jgi:RHS repeat-associated protein
VGDGSLGRQGIQPTQTFSAALKPLAGGADYGVGGLTESFRATPLGIEQVFRVAHRPAGTGPLVIDVPVSGLTAKDAGGGPIDLVNGRGQVRATYSGLAVFDAAGHALTASMSAAPGGRDIAIEAHDAGARYPLTVDPTWSQVAEMAPSGNDEYGWFGYSISISGDTAIVGAPNTTVNGNSSEGAAYIFSLGDGTWSQVTELTSPDGAASDRFGLSVAISGDNAIVGAPFHQAGGVRDEGRVYFFSLRAGTWSLATELGASDPQGDSFGGSVAMSGPDAIVGAAGWTGSQGTNEQGVAYLFSDSGGSWSQTAELHSPVTNAEYYGFGSGVAISGTTAVVGAPGNTQGDVATAWVFSEADGSWSETANLGSLGGGGVAYYGQDVALSGTTAVVGSYDAGAQQQGQVWVYTSSSGTWAKAAELVASDGQWYDAFGYSVATNGSTIVVGSEHPSGGKYGTAYVFSPSGTTWSQTDEFNASDQGSDDYFGNSVGMSGSSILVGSPYHGTDAVGAAYVFDGDVVQPQGAVPGPDLAGGGSPSESACPCKAGEPVDPATGDFYETATDLRLPGAGVRLEFSRTYDAQTAQAEVAAGTPTPPLGYGWAYNLGMVLTATASTATVTEEDGSQLSFSPYVAGTSPAWCTSATNYCSSAPRVGATLNHNANGTWAFVRTMGAQTTFGFSSAGALTSITDSQGDTLTESVYSPGGGQTPCPSGDSCTAWTSSASGRTLVLAVDSSGQLVSVFDANSTLAATFSYTGTSCSPWTGSQAPDLCGATDPGGITSSYTYDSGNSSADLDYDMVSGTPPAASGATTNVYNSTGQVTQQTDPAGEVTTFSYSGTNSTELGGSTTVTTYPLGTGTGRPQDQTVYQYSSNVLVAETTGAGTASASTEYFGVDPVSLLPLWSEDGDGNISTATYQSYNGPGGTPVSSANALTTTDALGNTTEHAYNGFNQAWCTVEPAEYADGARCPSSAPSAPPAPGASDPYPGVELSFYNSSDQLTATTDALGNTTTYSYTSGVAGVPNGLLYCSVDPVDYQDGVTCPAYGAAHVTGTTTATYDSAGDKTSSTDADGATATYVYDAPGLPGLVSSSTSPDGTTTAYTYNGAGQVTSQAQSFGAYSATTLYAYDPYGRRFCSVSPYESVQGVTCPSTPPSSPPTPGDDAYLGATITTYDADGRAAQVTNPLGGISDTAYDQAGEPFCTVTPAEAAGGVTCPSTPPASPPIPGDDPDLGATITTYDADGRVVQATNPLGGITLTSYDPANNVVQTTAESNNSSADPDVTTTYGYDADNQVTSLTVDPAGSLAATTVQAYDPNGNVYCSVSANAVASGSYQCPPWQPAWASTPPNPAPLYSSTPSAAQADNVTTTFYDADGDQLQSTNADTQTSIAAFDGDGRTYCTSDPVNVGAWLSAHPSGTYPYLCPATPPSTPPAQGSGPGYLTTIYDAAGRVVSSTDQAGDTTSYTYGPGGDVLTTTNPGGQVATNCYYYQDGPGACAAAAPAGGGSADDLYSSTTPATSADPSGEVTSYTYYPGDLADTTTTPAGATTDGYDALGDLTSVDYSATASSYTTPADLSFTYNVDGTPHTMADATGTTTYGYDAAEDVTSQALVAAGGSGLSNATVSYGYYTTGDLASLTYPAYPGSSDPEVNYTYDATGAMATATDWLGDEVSFGHDADGNMTAQDNAVSSADPAGTSSTTFSYDAADEPTVATSTLNQECSGDTESLSQSFSGSSGSMNADGQLTQYSASYSGSCSGQGSYQRDYSYDAAGRVVYQGSAPQGSAANNFAYDPAGDPTTISAHDSTGNFDTFSQSFDNAGEVTAQSPVSGSGGSSSTFTYDTLGDQTQVATATATTTYGYDQAGQMTTAATPAGDASYLYNGDGLVAANTTGSTTSQYTWDTNGTLPVLLSDGAYDYVYGPDGAPVEQVGLATSTPTYMTYSPADSSWLATNAAGDETGFWGYDAFGTLAFGTPTSAFGYAGQYTDATTGLSDMRARWYGPGTGEFTTVDPYLALTGQPYQYSGDDPVNHGDPTGQGSFWDDVASAVGDAWHATWSSAKSAVSVVVNPGAAVARSAENFVSNAESEGVLNAFNEGYNPAYTILNEYRDEWHAAESGCSLATDLSSGLAGAFDLATLVGGEEDEAAVESFEAAELASGAPEEAGSGTETFYRTMSKGNFEELQATGRVPATSETFISPSGEYASGYEGTTVRFSVRGGTTDALANVGVRDSSALTGAAYPDMPFVSSGWTSSSAFFKGEGGIINIGLGRGTALDIFNEGIVGWDVVP